MKKLILIGIIGLAACTVSFAQAVKAAVTNAVAPTALFPEEQFRTLLEQNRLDEAATLLASLENKEGIAHGITGYARARLAFERGQYTEALQHLAQIQGFNNRNSEELPAAVFLEGMIYKKNGQTNAAAFAAEELMLGWPESVWSRRTEELK
jgi:tetratricopeptide (TPR) repeat protein